jgi:hypothetical protein
MPLPKRLSNSCTPIQAMESDRHKRLDKFFHFVVADTLFLTRLKRMAAGHSAVPEFVEALR